jgi:hypothetical protein
MAPDRVEKKGPAPSHADPKSQRISQESAMTTQTIAAPNSSLKIAIAPDHPIEIWAPFKPGDQGYVAKHRSIPVYFHATTAVGAARKARSWAVAINTKQKWKDEGQ